MTGVITALDTAPAQGTVVGVATGGNTTLEVNGITWTLDDNVEIEVEDELGDPSSLALGQVVTLMTATDAGGTHLATLVAYEDDLEGAVFSVDLAGQKLVIMGQTVSFTDATRFASDDPLIPVMANIGQGNVVEVSGHPTPEGIRATRIEVKHADHLAYDGELELKGIITAADETALVIGGQRIDITHAEASDMPADKAQWPGLYVEVTADEVDPGAGTVTASQVQREDRASDGDDGEEAKQEGVLAYRDGTATVDGKAIMPGAGLTPEMLAGLDGRLVNVEGSYEGGMLVVDNITPRE